MQNLKQGNRTQHTLPSCATHN